MDKYISQDVAVEAVCGDCEYNATQDCEDCRMNRLIKLPAADVVEVVRCINCINWNGNDCITMYGLNAPRPNDYCSRGERMADNG